MRTSLCLFLILASISPLNAVADEPAPPPRLEKVRWPSGAISFGVGAQYELIGLQLAVVLPHFEPFLALGAATFLGGAAVGFRWFPDVDNRGAYFTLTGGRLFVGSSYDVPNAWFGEVGGGYRFGVAPGFFGQLGAAALIAASGYKDEPLEPTLAFDLDAAIGFSF
jgi:hypothetical protein